MRNKIFGTIGILWGGAIVGRWFLGSPQESSNTSFQSGQLLGLVLGFLMLGAGCYYVLKKTSRLGVELLTTKSSTVLSKAAS